MKRKNRRLYSFVGLALIPAILALMSPELQQSPVIPFTKDTQGSVNFTVEIPKLNWQYAPGRDFYIHPALMGDTALGAPSTACGLWQ